jgi:hypothetical protein
MNYTVRIICKDACTHCGGWEDAVSKDTTDNLLAGLHNLKIKTLDELNGMTCGEAEDIVFEVIHQLRTRKPLGYNSQMQFWMYFLLNLRKFTLGTVKVH